MEEGRRQGSKCLVGDMAAIRTHLPTPTSRSRCITPPSSLRDYNNVHLGLFISFQRSPSVRLPDCRIRVQLRRFVSRERPVSQFMEGRREDRGNDDGRVRVQRSVLGREEWEFPPVSHEQDRVPCLYRAR